MRSDFRIADSLSQRRVEAGAALLDRREVKAGGVGDRLQVVGGREVIIGSRNRGKLPGEQVGNGLRERVAEVRVLSVAAVPRPPTGVHGQLHQVGEPLDLLRAGRLAARQGAERLEI